MMNSTSNPGSRISSSILMTSSSWQTARHRISVATNDYTPRAVRRAALPADLHVAAEGHPQVVGQLPEAGRVDDRDHVARVEVVREVEDLDAQVHLAGEHVDGLE